MAFILVLEVLKNWEKLAHGAEQKGAETKVGDTTIQKRCEGGEGNALSFEKMADGEVDPGCGPVLQTHKTEVN